MFRGQLGLWRFDGNRSFCREVFSSSTILTAQNGEEAFDIFQNNEVDIILSDWEMPVMSGEELIYDVRNNSNNKQVA